MGINTSFRAAASCTDVIATMFFLVSMVSILSFAGAKPPTVEESTKPSQEDLFWGLEKPQEEYVMPQLPFAFDAMEPYIDASTMEIHYSAIFKEYTVRLNALLKKWKASGEKTAPLANTSLINIWRNLKELPPDIRKEFTQAGGGYINHLLYFSTMTPNSKDEKRSPSQELMPLIKRSFHNVTEMKKEFTSVARDLFGCGWVYIARATGYSDGDYLIVTSNLEEMVPLSYKRLSPILALDVWEHAYFKKYKNNRKEYISNWWKTIDWVKVERLLNWWRMWEPEVVVKHKEL